MIIAVASGKGGTGKTTVAASLATIWPRAVIAVDLDVEAPNLHLFLKPALEHRREAQLTIPEADESLCTYCGQCSALCQFKAISVLGDVLLTFPEMCHGCEGCLQVCPEKALTPATRTLGDIEWGQAGQIGFLMGRLKIGEAMSPPLMRQVKDTLQELQPSAPCDVIIDAPPGVSCPAVNAVMGSDVIVLVTEPTPFGLYDLRLAHRAFTPMGQPMGVVINRAGVGNNAIYDFCAAEALPILAEIPFDRHIAEAYADGKIIAETSAARRSLFQQLAERITVLAPSTANHKEAAHG
jgi:MinD superfamily P-loop ATPase